MKLDEMKEQIGADSLYFITLERLIKSVGGEKGFCKGCFNIDYPVERE